MKKTIILAVVILMLLLTACASNGNRSGEIQTPNTVHKISVETAREMMERSDGHIIVDVRRQDEYDEGHIPGAVCIPNESIGDEKPEALPDLGQIILVHCRSGVRSAQAAQKLVDLGYTNVYDFGGS